jgi:tellurite resistance protein TerC
LPSPAAPAKVDRFAHLKVGPAPVLIFSGAKMLVAWTFHVPVAISLTVVLALLAGSVVTSLIRSGR